MAFTNSRYTDASQSIFNDIGHDHNINTTINNPTIHITITNSAPEQIFSCLRQLGDVIPSASTPQAGTSSQKRDIAPTCHSTAASCDIATRLIIRLMQTLMHPEFSDYHDLKPVLKLLQKTLILVRLAVYTFEFTPLGRSLADVAEKELEQCRMILQELLYKINSYQYGLGSTRIWHMWPQVLWRGCDMEELASMRAKLLAHQESLDECLNALDS